MGGVVCSSVDAGVVKRKRKERCAGAIVKAARNANAKGTITMDEIGFDNKTKNCQYTGELDNVPATVPYSKNGKTRRSLMQGYQDYITENDDCDPENTVCLREDNKSIKKYMRDSTCIAMCRGYVVKKANEKGATGYIDASDITDGFKGAFRNRQCACLFNDESVTFLMNKSSQDKRNKDLRETYYHAKSNECDSSTEMCIRIPPSHHKPRVKVTRFGNSTYVRIV